MDWSQLLKNFAEAISPALQTLLNAVFLALATQASAFVYGKLKEQRSKLSADQVFYFDLFVRGAVKAAAQIYDEEQGDEKKAYVLNLANEYLSRVGFKIDAKEVDVIIESAVFDTLNDYPTLSISAG